MDAVARDVGTNVGSNDVGNGVGIVVLATMSIAIVGLAVTNLPFSMLIGSTVIRELGCAVDESVGIRSLSSSSSGGTVGISWVVEDIGDIAGASEKAMFGIDVRPAGVVDCSARVGKDESLEPLLLPPRAEANATMTENVNTKINVRRTISLRVGLRYLTTMPPSLSSTSLVLGEFWGLKLSIFRVFSDEQEGTDSLEACDLLSMAVVVERPSKSDTTEAAADSSGIIEGGDFAGRIFPTNATARPNIPRPVSLAVLYWCLACS